MALDWKVKVFVGALVFFVLALLVSAVMRPKDDKPSLIKIPSHGHRPKPEPPPKDAA